MNITFFWYFAAPFGTDDTDSFYLFWNNFQKFQDPFQISQCYGQIHFFFRSDLLQLC